MAGDIYLYLDGIPGESTSFHFKNWIDVMSFSLGVTMEIDQDARTGSGAGTSGAADPEDLSVETKMSIASPVLLECCAVGAVIPRARLIQCNVVNELRTIVTEYALGDSIISGVSLNASGGEIPGESISINYGSIIWRYHCYNHFDPSYHECDALRDWSVLTSKTGGLSSNDSAYHALQDINVPWKLVSPRDKEKEYQFQYSYSSVSPQARVRFTEGKVVDMPDRRKKES